MRDRWPADFTDGTDCTRISFFKVRNFDKVGENKNICVQSVSSVKSVVHYKIREPIFRLND